MARNLRSLARREFLKTAAATFALLPSAADSSALRAQQGKSKKTKPPLRWRIHEVSKIPDGYQVAVADVNGDGKPDILALSSEKPIIEWYENPGWRARPITTKTSGNISLAPFFFTGRPSRGIALATDFSLEDSTRGGNLWWAAPPASLDAEWPLAKIGQIPTSHRLRWGDIDGDGRLELVDAPLLGRGAHAPDYAIGSHLSWFTMPEEMQRGHSSAMDAPPAAWESHLIDDSLTVMHGVLIMDWDGDGRDEILTASFEGVHLFRSTGRSPNLHWTKTRLGAGDQPRQSAPGEGGGREVHRGSSEIGVGEIGGRRFLSTIEPWHGEQVVVYLAPHSARPGELWERHVIDSTFHDGHALACADFDGDGNTEIVAGYRGPGTSLFLYSSVDGAGLEWNRETLDTNMSAAGIALADINGDGRLDIVTIGASTGNVKWYENPGKGAHG